MADSNRPKIELRIEGAVEVLLFVLPYGAEQMNLPHNFWLGLVCWAVGAVVAARMFWIFPAWASRLSRLEKALIIFIFWAGCVCVFYRPVVTAYGKRNGDGEPKLIAQANTPTPIPSQTSPPASTVSPSPSHGALHISGAKKPEVSHNLFAGPVGDIKVEHSPGANIHDNTQIGSISTGNGGAVSVGQQGGVTAGTVNMPRQHANDPYDGYSDEWLIATAVAEADKIQRLGMLCMNDMDNILHNRGTTYFNTSTLDGVRFFFTVRMKECCIEDARKLHESILARAPNLRDPQLEDQFAYELLNKQGGCSNDEMTGVGVLVKYLRDLASGLRNQKPPSP